MLIPCQIYKRNEAAVLAFQVCSQVVALAKEAGDFEDDCPQREAHPSSELHLCPLPWNRSGRHMPCPCVCPAVHFYD